MLIALKGHSFQNQLYERSVKQSTPYLVHNKKYNQLMDISKTVKRRKSYILSNDTVFEAAFKLDIESTASCIS